MYVPKSKIKQYQTAKNTSAITHLPVVTNNTLQI